MSIKSFSELISQGLEKNGYSAEEAQKIFLLEMKVTKYFQFEGVIPECMELENIERDEKSIHYYWSSHSEHAECPKCHKISQHERHDYQSRPIQDIACDGLAVYHHVRLKRRYCDNPECEIKIFVERFYEFAGEKARKTHRFIAHCKDLAVANGNLPAEREIRAEGSVVCDDTISKYVKVEAAKVIKANLTQDNVRVLSVDDFNTRKGDGSSGCTVFIDQETHKVLMIVKGTTKEAAQSVIEKFPSAEFLSRDRSCSLSSAGDACGKIQVADRFHLIQNIHKAVEDALMAEIPANIFLKEGDGWVEITPESGAGTIFTVPQEDTEKRIQLADLSEVKAEKYRNTLKMLELSDKGLRTADIAKALEIPYNAVKELRRGAANIIEDVQEKITSRIENYPENSDGRGRPPADGKRKTLGAKPKPAHESIVEPYRNIVVEMWNAGNSHHKIHPAITAEGFSGSKAAVYQYIWKLEYEDPCVLTRKIKQKKPGAPWVDNFNKQDAQNLPDLTLENVTRNSVYKAILKECKSARPANADSQEDNKEEINIGAAKPKSKKPAMAKYSPLEQEYLDLMYGKDDEQPENETIPESTPGNRKTKKKTIDMQRIKDTYQIVAILVKFLIDFHTWLDLNDEVALKSFIDSYKNSEIDAVAQFVNGLIKDYDAVKNCLLYPNISNGPVEGINSRTKYVHRRGGGRASVELLCAFRVLAS
jgi:transposase